MLTQPFQNERSFFVTEKSHPAIRQKYGFGTIKRPNS
jgi:hypothetical protein